MRKLPRRQFLYLAGGAIALPVVSRIASAQVYPTKPVRIIVGFSAGGAVDIVARLLGNWLSERLGQQFVIENRPGAGTNIGTEAVARASADGYTLLEVSLTNATNATLYDKLNFNFIRDIAPVASIGRTPFFILVNASFPTKTVPELIAYAKANPGKIHFASPGIGTAPHVAGELLKMMAEIDIVHVPYRGNAPAMTDLLSGQVQVFFGSSESIEYIKAGRVRALAVTSAMRSKELPELPAVGDFVPGYEVTGWQGVGAPKSTPPEIIDKLNREINAGLADPKLKGRLAHVGYAVFASSPTDFGKFIAAETQKWAKVIRAANIKAE